MKWPRPGKRKNWYIHVSFSSPSYSENTACTSSVSRRPQRREENHKDWWEEGHEITVLNEVRECGSGRGVREGTERADGGREGVFAEKREEGEKRGRSP